ncbi:nuclear pore complex protein Nup98-Nup96 [Nilaparvata lugens]|uniref:nuclear pore complex protein Nup98-Nup96 n=1 Tax=Nilaparvata lugens TaxID=108931 RepID=UPI00193DEED8|nr:nuclear pore complex protein Nup98-Nup96 [Nilaparvata lugens]
MEVCKYYREGYCRYGSRCRYLHPNSNDYSYGYSDHNYGKYYGDDYNSKSRQQKGYSGGSSNNSNYNYRSDNSDQRYKGGNSNSSNQNTYDLWSLIEKELKVVEEGRQWPLTCFSVSREYGNVPGWDDHSPEELRHEYYKSFKEGTVDQFVSVVFENFYCTALQTCGGRRNDFKSKSRALPILEALIRNRESYESSNNAASSTQDQNTNLWQNKAGSQQSTSLFGGNSGTTGLFGGNNSSNQPATGIFGGNNTTTPQTTGIFGGNSSTTPQATGIFGGNSSQQATGLFGNNSAQPATGIFGGGSSTPQTAGLFGGNSSSTGIFGGNMNSTQQTTGIFGGNSAQVQPNVFSNTQFTNTGGTFSFNLPQAQQNSNSFLSGANPVASSVFQSTASPFQSQQVSQNTPNIFQQSAQVSSTPFNQPVQSVFMSTGVDDDLMNYTMQEALTESELAMYQAKAFQFGKIPLKPPPKEVC